MDKECEVSPALFSPWVSLEGTEQTTQDNSAVNRRNIWNKPKFSSRLLKSDNSDAVHASLVSRETNVSSNTLYKNVKKVGP